MKKYTIRILSYKAAQGFKKDYVRLNGQFQKFHKSSGNHKCATVEFSEGEELDARGSAYQMGRTRWDAHKCQSWARFAVRNGEVVALNYDGEEINIPHWAFVNKPAEVQEEEENATV